MKSPDRYDKYEEMIENFPPEEKAQAQAFIDKQRESMKHAAALFERERKGARTRAMIGLLGYICGMIFRRCLNTWRFLLWLCGVRNKSTEAFVEHVRRTTS